MRESKLIKQLKILNTEEFKGFYAFIRSPYFNKSKDVLLLFDRLRKYYPAFDSPHLEKEKIFKKLFARQPFSDIKLRNLRTKLSKLVENYLIQLEYEQDDFKKKKLLTQIYGKRNHYVEFERGTENLLKELEEQPYRDAEYFYEKYLLQRNFYFHIGTPKHKDGYITSLLKEAILNIEQSFVLERLYLGIDLKNREWIFSESHDFELEFQSSASTKKQINYQMLLKIFHLLKYRTEQLFWEAKDYYFNNIGHIRHSFSKEIFYLLTNFSIQQIRKKEEFIPILFELYKLGIAQKLPFEGGKIENGTFLNIVQVSSKLKAFDWADKFVKEYGTLVVSNEKVKDFAISYLCFHEGKFEEVIDVLSSAKFSSILYQKNAKTLLLRTYYKMFKRDDSYYSLFLAQNEAFNRFLHRNKKIDSKLKQAYLNFNKLIKKIAKLDYHKNWNKQEKDIFFAILDSPKEIALRSWLKEVVQDS